MSDGARDAQRLFGADPLRGRGDILREEQLKAAIERELAAKHRIELEARLIEARLRVVDAILDHIEEAKREDPYRADAYYDRIIKLLVPAQE